MDLHLMVSHEVLGVMPLVPVANFLLGVRVSLLPPSVYFSFAPVSVRPYGRLVMSAAMATDLLHLGSWWRLVELGRSQAAAYADPWLNPIATSSPMKHWKPSSSFPCQGSSVDATSQALRPFEVELQRR
uniref:Uncharacterized protein n=1 Tax=Arundo donax TaxID=35708 RepID=A0A0A8ZU67_ARUDO